MRSDLRQYRIVPVQTSVLREAAAGYNAPNDRITRQLNNGDLIRLRRGLYVVDSNVSGELISHNLIANHIYGPSYVSMQSALSHYSLIPERVYTTVSSITSRSREFQTPIGLFEYVRVPEETFSVGLRNAMIQDEFSFLIASPEKAISDLVITTAGLRLQSARAAYEYLVEDMRIDIEYYEHWEPDIFLQCAEAGRNRRELRFIYEVIRNG